MHPALIILPALGLIIGPRLWVSYVLRQYDDAEDRPDNARDIARDMLDRHGLYAVAVEPTDIGDHYDPDSRTVRLSKRNFDSTSLTAITIAAHEVAHAQQHALDYPPFVWRDRLARVAQVTGVAGTALVVAVPLTFVLAGRQLPIRLIGGAALAVFGTATAAQLAALPTELDASFGRALPMLRQGYLTEEQLEDAHRILYACSLTYLTAPFAGLVHVWPWLRPGRGPLSLQSGEPVQAVRAAPEPCPPRRPSARASGVSSRRPAALRGGTFETGLRRVLKPLVRRLLIAADTQYRAGGVVRDARGDRPK